MTATATRSGRNTGPKLTAEQLAAVGSWELARRGDPRPWIEANLSIRTKRRQIIPFQFKPAQVAYYEKLTGRGLILKARQLGFTTEICGLFFADTILNENTASVIIAHDKDSARKIFRIVRLMWDRLPEDWRAIAGAPRLNNVGEILWPRINSSFYVGTAGGRTFGRGQTINNLHCSEFAYWRDAEEALAAVSEAVPVDARVVIESTANGQANAFYRQWTRAMEGESNFSPHFFPWWWEREYRLEGERLRTVTAEEARLMREHRLGQAQIRWRRFKQRELGPRFPQEYPEDSETCFLTTGRSYLDLGALREMERQFAKQPVAVEDQGRLRIWEQPDPKGVYLLEVDVAEGKGENRPGDEGEEGGPDFSVCNIRDYVTGRQVACWHGRLSEVLFGHKVFGLLQRWWGRVVVESNGPGGVVVQTLADLCPAELWFDAQDARPGLRMTTQRRLQGLARVAQMIVEQSLMMRDARWYAEARRFVVKPSGKAEAEEGAHDDRLMAVVVGELVRSTVAPPRRKQGRATRPKFEAPAFDRLVTGRTT